MLLPDLLQQKGDGGRRGFRLGPAAGEGGVVIQIVGLGEVEEGEAVPEDDGPVRQAVEEGGKVPVQRLQFQGVGFGARGVGPGVFRVQGGQPVQTCSSMLSTSPRWP